MSINKIQAATLMAMCLHMTSAMAQEKECKIEYWQENDFVLPNQKVIDFIDMETGGLFFQASVTYSHFQKKFKLLSNPPGDKNKFWNDGRSDKGYVDGPWFGAYMYTSGGYVQEGDFSGYNWNGPIYLKDGLGYVESRNVGSFPYKIYVYKNLASQYHSTDVFNAIRDKFGIKDLKSCIYQGQGDIGGRICGASNPLLFKHRERYFQLAIYVHGMKDHREGTGKLGHTVINYVIEDKEYDVRQYKECLSIREKGRALKL